MKSLALQSFEDTNVSSWRTLSPVLQDQDQADFCSREGARALKAKIEAYWRERGQEVILSLHNVGFHPAIRAARYDLRSDMVNGMPRTAIHAGQKGREDFSLSLVETETDFDGDTVSMDN